MKVALVSGAGGFLGKTLVDELLQKKMYSVRALTTQKEKMNALFGSNPDFSVTDEIPENVDVFFNCAFPSNADGIRMASGLKYIAELFCQCKKKNVRAVINISTQSVYSQKRIYPADESTPCNLESQYAVGKYAVEQLTNSIFSSIPHVNLRLASMIGPESNQRITNRFVQKVIAGEDLHVVEGKQLYGFLDVRDAVDAIVRFSLVEPNLWQEVYNVGSDWNYTLQDVASCVVKVGAHYGYFTNVIRENDDGKIRNSTLISQKLQQLLNWKAKITLEQTIHDIYQEYQKNETESKNTHE